MSIILGDGAVLGLYFQCEMMESVKCYWNYNNQAEWSGEAFLRMKLIPLKCSAPTSLEEETV